MTQKTHQRPCCSCAAFPGEEQMWASPWCQNQNTFVLRGAATDLFFVFVLFCLVLHDLFFCLRLVGLVVDLIAWSSFQLWQQQQQQLCHLSDFLHIKKNKNILLLKVSKQRRCRLVFKRMAVLKGCPWLTSGYLQKSSLLKYICVVL